MSTAPVLVVGDLMVDVVATATEPIAHASDAGAKVRWSGGGAAGNVAAWLAAGGTPVVLATRVGDDLAGRGAVEELRAAGVDVRAAVDPERPTGTCVVVVGTDGERTMLPDRGANDALSPADLPDDVEAGDLYLSGYTLLHPGSRAAGLAALDRAREAGMRIAVDPASAAPLRACPQFVTWMDGVGVLLPNRDELAVLSGTDDVEGAARSLAAWVGEVVVKLGADGALWTDGARVVAARAMPVDVVDTTGAGDAFAAGWLAARADGADVDQALRAACAAGARAVAHVGARPD
jgi:sugar/nucleoside kinase (ribokinase family)